MKISLYNNNKVWFYKVKKTDEIYNEKSINNKDIFNIERFSQRFNFVIADFEKLNGKIKKITAGDVLLIPPSSKYCHIVAPTETPNIIIKKYGLGNNTDLNSNKKLFIGQKIFL